MRPSDTMIKRAECYSKGDYEGVFSLYSPRSEFRMFFLNKELYVEHAVNFQSKQSKFVNLTIVSEKERGNIAEVRFIEHFIEDAACETHVRYFTSATLVNEDGRWRILKEKREVGER